MVPTVSRKERAAMVMVALIVARIGLSLIFAPIMLAGATATWFLTALCIVGHGALVGGLYAAYEALFNPQTSWSDFSTAFCRGFFVGCVSSACSLTASAYPFKVAEFLGVTPRFAASLLGGVCGLITNGFANLANDRDFFDNWLPALLFGADVGFVCFGSQYGFGRDTEAIFTKIVENMDEVIHEFAPWLKFDWKAVARAVCNFRTLQHTAHLIHAFGQDVIALFALWITAKTGKAGAANAEDSFTASDRPRSSTLPDGKNPGVESPPDLALTASDSQVLDQPPTTATQNSSSTSHDPHSDGGNSTSAGVSHRISLEENTKTLKSPLADTNESEMLIPIPSLIKPQSQTQEKHSRSERNTDAIKSQIAKVFRENMPVFDENVFVRNIDELIILHRNYEKISRKVQEEINPNYIYATTDAGGTRLGGSDITQSSSSSQQKYNIASDSSNEDGKKLGSNLGQKEEDFERNHAQDSRPRLSNQPVSGYGIKVVTVHKLITVGEENNYQLTDKAEWPAFVGKMRIIGLMGAPQSGKTTFAQAIVFQLGYAISQTQAMLTRLPIGVHAYVLHDHNLIIVECCEGIDPPVGPHDQDQKLSQSPYGALLLELLMYLFCMKVMYLIPFNSKMTDKIKQYARKRINMFMSGAAAHKAARQQHIAFVLRVKQNIEEYEGEAAVLRNYLTIPQTQSLYSKWLANRKQIENDVEMENVQALNTITVNALRLYEEDDSLTQKEEYERQLQEIINIITSTANDEGSHLDMNDGPIDYDRFHLMLDLIWKTLANSKCLEQIISNIRAEEEVESGEDTFKVKEFFDGVNIFLKKLTNPCYKSIIDDYKKHTERMKEKAEKFKRCKDDDQTPELFVESVIKAAHLILRKSFGIVDSKLKEEGIRTGLNGYVILVKGGAKTKIETMTLRMALFECELISYLKEPEIYNYYPECWFLLTQLARSGFRLHVLEFDIWKATSVHLERKQLNNEYEANIYLQILCLLEELTDPDPRRCVPDMVRHTDIFFSREIPIELIAFNFEKKVKDTVSLMVKKILRDSSKAQSVYTEWLELTKKWFNDSEFSSVKFDTEEERKQSVNKLLGTLMSRNLEILYRLIAEMISQEIVARSSVFITKKFDEKNREIERIRLLLWKNTAENSKQNKQLFCSLLETKLVEFLIEEFITKSENSPNFPYAHNTLCAIISAENIHKEDEIFKRYILESCAPANLSSSTNIHTISELTLRDKRWQLAQRWTLSRLRCLECNVVEKLSSYFYNRMHPDGIEFLLSALVTYFVNGNNVEEKKLSEAIYLSRRHALLERVASEMDLSVKEIDMMRKNEELNEANYGYQTQLSVLTVGCQFTNLIMAVYYNDESNGGKFFEAREDGQKQPENSETFKMIISAAKNLYDICTSESVIKSEKDTVLKMHYFNMLLNLASVCQKSINSILLNNGITNIGTIDHAADPIQITRTEEEFLNLKVDIDYKRHHKLIIVAADLLMGKHAFATISDTLTRQIKKLQKDIKRLIDERRKYKEWIENETRRREKKMYEETKKTKLAVTSKPVIFSSSLEISYAIEDVPYCSSHYGHRWPRKPSYNDIKQTYEKGVHEAFLDAYALFMFNNINQKEGEFEELRRFFGKLTKSPKKLYQIRKENELVVKMLQFLHFEEILGKCGYSLQTKIVNNIQEEHFVTNDENFKSEYATLFCQEIISLKERNARLLLDSRFIPVPVGMDLKKQLLPSAFFDPAHKDYAFHSKLSIQELLDRRPQLDRVPSQLRYTLIRVSHKDTGDCYQAVFTPEDKVYYVLEQLSSWGITRLYKEEDGDLDEELSGIGGFVIQLTCY